MNPRLLGRWRKLYCSPSTAWLALSYSARGLGYELLRVCDDEGRIALGGLDAFEAVARLCAIGTRDRREALADYRALLKDGFIVVDGGALVVRNFVEAQGARSPEAERKAALRARAADARSTSARREADVYSTSTRRRD